MENANQLLEDVIAFDTQAGNAVERAKKLRAKIENILTIEPGNTVATAASNILKGHEETLRIHEEAA